MISHPPKLLFLLLFYSTCTLHVQLVIHYLTILFCSQFNRLHTTLNSSFFFSVSSSPTTILSLHLFLPLFFLLLVYSYFLNRSALCISAYVSLLFLLPSSVCDSTCYWVQVQLR